MGCNCNGPAPLVCNKKELAECVKIACEKGHVSNSSWETKKDAEDCAKKWTERTGIPHYITVLAEEIQGPFDSRIPIDRYTLVSCPLDTSLQ